MPGVPMSGRPKVAETSMTLATLRLKAALLFRPNTIVIDVPYHFEDVP